MVVVMLVGWGCPGFVVKDDGQTLICKFHQLTKDKVAWDTYGEVLDLRHKIQILNLNTDTKEEGKRKYNDIRSQMNKMHGFLDGKLRHLERLEKKIVWRLQQMEEKYDAIVRKLDMLLFLENNEETVISLPECPICLETMSHDTKIAHCLSGP